jgi:hypothetical protein
MRTASAAKPQAGNLAVLPRRWRADRDGTVALAVLWKSAQTRWWSGRASRMILEPPTCHFTIPRGMETRMLSVWRP